jgi:hypothetical protein
MTSQWVTEFSFGIQLFVHTVQCTCMRIRKRPFFVSKKNYVYKISDFLKKPRWISEIINFLTLLKWILEKVTIEDLDPSKVKRICSVSRVRFTMIWRISFVFEKMWRDRGAKSYIYKGFLLRGMHHIWGSGWDLAMCIVRSSDWHCQSCNSPRFNNPSILRVPTQWNLKGGRWNSVE